MNYTETIEYLYTQLPMYSRIGDAAYKKDIDNTIALCEALGNPQNQFKSIHIAGTNGKGSSSNMLAAILQQQGYKTGLYTSPHIKEFGERIRINGIMIDQQFVIDFTEKTKKICQAIKPSFFELTVAMAFDYFASQKIDIAVIETGLGGRLDSTNIITPLLSIITNIGMDHTNLLGNTIEEIAFEKAGIIKKNIPVVIGEVNEKTKPIFEKKLAEMTTQPVYAAELFHAQHIENTAEHSVVKVTNLDINQSATYSLDLRGSYQLKNLQTVLAALHVMNRIGFNISIENIKKALANVKKITGLRGRWDIVSEKPRVIYDVAHNKDGIIAIMKQLNATHQNDQLHFVMGFVNDKDINSILDLLPDNAHYYFTNAHIPRALPKEKLLDLAFHKRLNGECYDDVNKAIEEAKKKAAAEDIIMVCGSFFILSEIEPF